MRKIYIPLLVIPLILGMGACTKNPEPTQTVESTAVVTSTPTEATEPETVPETTVPEETISLEGVVQPYNQDLKPQKIMENGKFTTDGSYYLTGHLIPLGDECYKMEYKSIDYYHWEDILGLEIGDSILVGGEVVEIRKMWFVDPTKSYGENKVFTEEKPASIEYGTYREMVVLNPIDYTEDVQENDATDSEIYLRFIEQMKFGLGDDEEDNYIAEVRYDWMETTNSLELTIDPDMSISYQGVQPENYMGIPYAGMDVLLDWLQKHPEDFEECAVIFQDGMISNVLVDKELPADVTFVLHPFELEIQKEMGLLE